MQVTDALEGVDFTPVSFWKGRDSGDPEKVDPDEKTKETLAPRPNIALQMPALTRQISTANAGAGGADVGTGRQRVQDRGSSIYSEDVGTPIMLSSSPPLISEMTPAPTRLAKVAVVRSRSMSHGRSKSSVSVLVAAPHPPPGLQAHVSGLRKEQGTSDEDESSSEASPVGTRGPSPVIPRKANVAGDDAARATGDDILTRVPTRSSSIQSKRSSTRRNLMKQGLPATPRSGTRVV